MILFSLRSLLLIVLVTTLVTITVVSAIEYGYTSTIIKPHLPGKVTLVNSSLKLQDVHVNFTTSTVTAQIYNNGTAAESSTVYVGVNSITDALYSSPGFPYTVQPHSTATVNVQIPIDLTRAYNIIVTW